MASTERWRRDRIGRHNRTNSDRADQIPAAVNSIDSSRVVRSPRKRLPVGLEIDGRDVHERRSHGGAGQHVHLWPVVAKNVQHAVWANGASRRGVGRHPFDDRAREQPTSGPPPFSVDGHDARVCVVLERDAAIAIVVREAGNPATTVVIEPRQRSLITQAEAVRLLVRQVAESNISTDEPIGVSE